MGERGRKREFVFVEIRSKKKVSKRGRKRRKRFVEIFAKSQNL